MWRASGNRYAITSGSVPAFLRRRFSIAKIPCSHAYTIVVAVRTIVAIAVTAALFVFSHSITVRPPRCPGRFKDLGPRSALPKAYTKYAHFFLILILLLISLSHPTNLAPLMRAAACFLQDEDGARCKPS